MPKVLSQAGISLADTYDVEGSIAGIETLESRDVSLVHEMGATILSERLSGTIRRVSTAALAQNTAFDSFFTDLPAGISRILGITVFSDVAARVGQLSVMARDPTSGREQPLWVWQSTNDLEFNVRMSDNGAAAANHSFYRPIHPIRALPSLIIGGGQPQRVSDVAFRGLTNAFGAGTVTVVLIMYIALMQVGGISSRGLPVPGW